MMKMTRRVAATFMAVGLVAISACSGEDSSEDIASTTTTAAATTTSTSTVAPASTSPAGVLTGAGVTEDVIRVGLNADLSGPFSTLVSQMVDAQQVFWETVNEKGGIAGRQVELVILDNAYDVATHLDNHDRLSDTEGSEAVVIVSQSTGSPHTAATADALVEDDLLAIPLSRYSGFAEEEFGAHVLESYANYCFESMNGVEFLSEQFGAQTVAILSLEGEYGEDGAIGATIAADALGLEVVFDGRGALVVGEDPFEVVAALVEAAPDMVWIAATPSLTLEVFAKSYERGLRALWSGNRPTYSHLFHDTDLAPTLDESFYYSSHVQLWNTEGVEGMSDLVDAMRAKRPDAPVSDVYVVGWTQAMIVHQILEQAAANGDLTRAGVTAAAFEIEADLAGLAPNQNWSGDMNDTAVRASYIYDVDLSNFTPGATVSDEDAATGFTLIAGPYVGEVAASHDFTQACYAP